MTPARPLLKAGKLKAERKTTKDKLKAHEKQANEPSATPIEFFLTAEGGKAESREEHN